MEIRKVGIAVLHCAIATGTGFIVGRALGSSWPAIILGGDKAIWFAGLAIGKKIGMKEWKTRFLTGTLSILYVGAVSVAGVALGVFAFKYRIPIMISYAIYTGGIDFLAGAIQRKVNPYRIIDNCLPESLDSFPYMDRTIRETEQERQLRELNSLKSGTLSLLRDHRLLLQTKLDLRRAMNEQINTLNTLFNHLRPAGFNDLQEEVRVQALLDSSKRDLKEFEDGIRDVENNIRDLERKLEEIERLIRLVSNLVHNGILNSEVYRSSQRDRSEEDVKFGLSLLYHMKRARVQLVSAEDTDVRKFEAEEIAEILGDSYDALFRLGIYRMILDATLGNNERTICFTREQGVKPFVMSGASDVLALRGELINLINIKKGLSGLPIEWRKVITLKLTKASNEKIEQAKKEALKIVLDKADETQNLYLAITTLSSKLDRRLLNNGNVADKAVIPWHEAYQFA